VLDVDVLGEYHINVCGMD